jgi:hypothetical protein
MHLLRCEFRERDFSQRGNDVIPCNLLIRAICCKSYSRFHDIFEPFFEILFDGHSVAMESQSFGEIAESGFHFFGCFLTCFSVEAYATKGYTLQIPI